MAIRSENEIYDVLEKVLRASSEPMTCVALMDVPEVRKAATSEYGNDLQVATNKLSDTLGFMWRRDVLNRHLAPSDNRARARYAYTWRENPATPASSPLVSPTRKKPTFNITESDTDVRIEFDNVTLIVRRT